MGRHALVTTSLMIGKLRLLDDISFPIMVFSGGLSNAWFGGSSSRISWNEHQLVRFTSSVTSMVTGGSGKGMCFWWGCCG